ncbi:MULTISPECIES: hypothetical protein [unclassified Streptomyces]|uniref:hypothetical protein n=1 Tax=unclassified Streptomyces TaxID=2593676 RepID=UPI002250F1EE|nr:MULTISPECIES: hypothetical protein [unclassified Streptomyces]MCX4650262.1 hypothetical protein [Streptomyces sp. NBC_01446]MCX5323891.1 hypothetical protein [Streptomyces sp. NBC_00120]MCX5327741.1 hypothetical protein [Streptomyces sp. NBC_00120]
MPSVIGLLEERERAAAERVEVLRTEADRVLAALREAELDWERFVVSRETVVEVLAGPDGVSEADTLASGDPEPSPSPSGAVPGSVVPEWCEGLVVSVLSPEYQRIMTVLIAAQRALFCLELASELGVEPVAAKVEGVRSKANRLVRQGWLVKEPSGRFALRAGVRGGGS